MILDQFDSTFSESNAQNTNWALLSSYDFAFDSELLMLTDALTEAQINNHTIDKSNGAINPLLSGKNGHVQLYVDKNKWTEAQQILKNQRVTSNEVFDSTNKDFHRPTWIYIVVFFLLAFFLATNFQKLIYIIQTLF